MLPDIRYAIDCTDTHIHTWKVWLVWSTVETSVRQAGTPKVTQPEVLVDFSPISITPVLTSFMERLIVTQSFSILLLPRLQQYPNSQINMPSGPLVHLWQL